MVLCILGLEGAGKILKNSRYPGVVDGAIATPSWTPGRFGMAYRSTAANSDPSIASHPLLDGLFASGNPTTLLFWGTGAGIITRWQKFQSDQSTVVWNVNTNATGLQMSLFSTNGGRFTPIGTYNNDAKMHQYAFVYDGVSDWKTLSSYQSYQDGLPLVMSSSQNNPQNPQRSDTGGNIVCASTGDTFDHLLAWNGRTLTAGDIRDLYVNPFSFMYVNQRSRILEAAAGVKTQRKPFVFTVT